MEKIENEVEEMIPIIFLNKTNRGINMCLEGIQDSYDMFCFCIDLFTKGLLLLYSNNTNKVDLTSLTTEQLQHAIAQLKKAHIHTTIKNDINEIPFTGIVIPPKNVDFELEDYIVTINMMHHKHEIFFSLQRYMQ